MSSIGVAAVRRFWNRRRRNRR